HGVRGVQARLPRHRSPLRLVSDSRSGAGKAGAFAAGRLRRAYAAGGRGTTMTWEYSLAGLLIGILVGMTGMGAGSLMTPMLIRSFGFDAKTAVGTDILHGAVFKSFGAWRHRTLGNVHVPLALWMLVGSAPLSLVGVQIASSFSDTTQSKMGQLVGG